MRLFHSETILYYVDELSQAVNALSGVVLSDHARWRALTADGGFLWSFAEQCLGGGNAPHSGPPLLRLCTSKTALCSLTGVLGCQEMWLCCLPVRTPLGTVLEDFAPALAT